ncbi:hypothetical protein Ahy_B08g093066 [Arachis hypogaea]|uniref:AMP-dependent synthetase/ligase domain-containing protein n=1 Tax=Arachis hypogaea TaxID=3818 RepID=A0A444Y592_ARAHY|nr:hypothetical protein Ahy_B08g093066 [Arachis hypogaea]
MEPHQGLKERIFELARDSSTISNGSLPDVLWTVPMFHCNGWCLPWGMAAQFGTNICLRKVKSKDIFDNVTNYKVTQLGGAPKDVIQV